MTLNWDKLRSDPAVSASFEALCCQLASEEQVPENSQFIRKAPPDSGIECFWRLPNDSEWGWQAKYFRTSPTPSQWKQIDSSVKRALETHPNLKKYFLCLPIDLSDARKTGRKSARDKWEEHVNNWKQISNIEFVYWGDFEIAGKLNDQKHDGSRKYFFDKEFLPSDWFDRKLKESLKDAGPRYSSVMNVKLPISRTFDILGRTPEFYKMLKQDTRDILRDFQYSKNDQKVSVAASEFDQLNSKIYSITKILNSDKSEHKPINFKKIHEECVTACKVIHEIILKLEDKAKTNIEKHNENDFRIKNFNNKIYHLWELQKRLRKLQEWTESDCCRVANSGALLLRGDAGTGKTHLLCDIANQRIKSKRFSILLHGGHFTNGNPKQWILNELDLDCTFDEFLGALNAVGQINNSKTLIMIDALNEGAGPQIWQKYLAGFLQTISMYPWIGMAMSVRTSYEEIVIPKHIESETLSRFTHTGFESKTNEAMEIFFDNNGIERPRVPLLVPEFSNPQFLVILCKGLKDKNLTKIPNELKGLSSIYNFLIDAVNEKLSRYDMLDYGTHTKIVHKAIERLAECMASKDDRFLPYRDAENDLQEIYPSSTRSKSLIHHLISEGLLREELVRRKSGDCEQVVQFAYERLGDNLIIQNQLKDITIKQDTTKLFLKNGSFAKYFQDKRSTMRYSGMIEAIAIQLPEKFNQELIEIKPSLANYDVVLESFLGSFMWRHPTSITKSSLRLIEKHVLKKRRYMNTFFKIILTVSADPALPINGEYLHKYLSGLEMGDRDSIWSTFLHDNYYSEDSTVKRWIGWAQSADKSHILPESFCLAGLTLAWFLTSSNRLVRDRATKALISLLVGRIDTLMMILTKFATCNDPYVVERLFCTAYGCAMRCNDKSKLKILANYTYSNIFKNTNPPLNILLRSYAKGIIDYAIHKGIEFYVDYKKLNPPYHSKWIQHFPTQDDINKLRVTHSKTSSNGMHDSAAHIFNSLSQMGDFYRYIIEPNLNQFDWSTKLLPANLSREEIFEKFIGSMTNEQKTLWENYYRIISEKESYGRRSSNDRKQILDFNCEDDELNNIVKQIEEHLRKRLNTNHNVMSRVDRIQFATKYLRELLDAEQKHVFDKHIIPYMEYSFNRERPKNYHDLKLFVQWMSRRIFELGWTNDRFSKFDHDIFHSALILRSDNKPERIGKKYQWIVYFELLARISDNFEFIDDSGERAFRKYHSPSQLMNGRDIDPSLLISKTFTKDVYDEPYSSWWFPFVYDSWDSQNNDAEWLIESDLPALESIIEVTDPKDDSKWLVLGGSFELKQKTPIDQNNLTTPERNIFFWLGSCLANKSDIPKLYQWGTTQTYRGIRFPTHDHTNDHTNDTFLGELYWEKSMQHAMHGKSFWTRQGYCPEELPANVSVPIWQYCHARAYDSSTDEKFCMLLPNELLVEKMGLINKIDGTFVNSDDNLVAYDPSVSEYGPSMLLVRKDNFVKFLQKYNYGVIWHTFSQKIALESISAHSEHRLESSYTHGVYRMLNNKVKGIHKMWDPTSN